MTAVLDIFLVLCSVLVTSKVSINEKISFVDYTKLTVNWENSIDVTISDMTPSSNFFEVVLFLLSSLVIDPSFMSISSLVLEL